MACSEHSCSVRLHAAVTRLTMGELALFERLVEALTESEVCMVGGTIQKLFDFKVTGAGLGWSRPGGLLNESMKKRHTRGISNHSSCNIRAEETGSGWACWATFPTTSYLVRSFGWFWTAAAAPTECSREGAANHVAHS